MTTKHLFYGTLRRGNIDLDDQILDGHKNNKTYNYERFGAGTQKYIKTLRIPGFKMYNLGYYPCVIESDNLEDEITVELHEVNEDAAQKIYFMEKGAGYLSKRIEIDGEKSVIYFCTPGFVKQQNKQNNLIESGDWCS